MNILVLSGRVVADPTISTSASGKTLAKFRIAVRRDKDATDFFNITAFGKIAETAERFLSKGTQITLSGMLRNNNYEKDGKTIYNDEIIANVIDIHFDKKDAGTGDFTPYTGGQIEGFSKLSSEDIPF